MPKQVSLVNPLRKYSLKLSEGQEQVRSRSRVESGRCRKSKAAVEKKQAMFHRPLSALIGLFDNGWFDPISAAFDRSQVT